MRDGYGAADRQRHKLYFARMAEYTSNAEAQKD